MKNEQVKDLRMQQDFGFEQVTNLLHKLADAGGVIPARYALGMEEPEASPGEWQCCREARLDLGNSLSFAFKLREILPSLTRDADVKARSKMLVSLRVQLLRTQSLLKPIYEDPILEGHLSAKTAADIDCGLTLGELIDALKFLNEAAFEVIAQIGTSAPLPNVETTPQVLLYQQLAVVFREHIEADPTEGLTRTWMKPGGPFAIFVKTAHAMAGLPITDSALHKALSRAGLMQKTTKKG